jgi:heme/copper-type cytochrome/quinol oxidase subunit 2
MKIAKSLLLVISVIILGIFLFFNKTTPQPGASSGNGNPAILAVLFLIPLFILLVLLWVRVFTVHSISNLGLMIFAIGNVIHLIIAFFYQKKEFNEYRQVIAEAILKRTGFVDMEYIDAITRGLSIHVNNQYFNLNTYFMFMSLQWLLPFCLDFC